MISLDFKQETTNARIYNIGMLFGTSEKIDSIDFDIDNLSATVDYSVTIEETLWGIDGIDLSIHSIIVRADITVNKEFLSKEEAALLVSKGFKEYNDDFTIFGWELKITDNINIDDSVLSVKQICINDIDVNISLSNNGNVIVSADVE